MKDHKLTDFIYTNLIHSSRIMKNILDSLVTAPADN